MSVLLPKHLFCLHPTVPEADKNAPLFTNQVNGAEQQTRKYWALWSKQKAEKQLR